ncbi:MAG: PASTA domain-containing protein [Deltaproteobacteria bacterium]|nr:PASTA domain-containing protein [Deltaproteobacteria bacterium]
MSKPAKPSATPTTNRTARKPGTQVAAKRTTTTAVASLPAVSAPPAGSAAAPASDDPVLMPDFRGETLDSVRRIATRNRLILEVRGTGLAIDQQPTPGTVVVGSKRHVLVSFSDGGREG